MNNERRIGRWVNQHPCHVLPGKDVFPAVSVAMETEMALSWVTRSVQTAGSAPGSRWLHCYFSSFVITQGSVPSEQILWEGSSELEPPLGRTFPLHLHDSRSLVLVPCSFLSSAHVHERGLSAHSLRPESGHDQCCLLPQSLGETPLTACKREHLSW